MEVALKDTDFSNSWDFWIYPAEVNVQDTGDVIITNEWNDETKKVLANGGKVLLFPKHKVIKKSINQ